MRKKKNISYREQMFVVLNQQGEVFIGLKGGYPVYSPKWDEAKPLFKSSTTHLALRDKIELIEENEFFN